MPVELPCDQCDDVFLTVPTRQRHIRIKHRKIPVSQETHPSPPPTPSASIAPSPNEQTTAPKPTTKTNPNATAKKTSPPKTKDATKLKEEALKKRREEAYKLAKDFIPNLRKAFIAEMINTDPENPGFYLYVPECTVDVSQVQAYYTDHTMVTPLADADFRKCVKLLANNPFTMPGPLTTNFPAFVRHLEFVCDRLVTKKALSMRKPLRFWPFTLSEIGVSTLVFMALQDAAAINKRIKYTEEMVDYDYDDLMVVFESEVKSESMPFGPMPPDVLATAMTDLGLINPGQGPEDLTEETMEQFRGMSLPKILETLMGKGDPQLMEKLVGAFNAKGDSQRKQKNKGRA
ncbi:hypothetical protein DFS34DRAFT_588826 [Phlyctochytrium arcticum]|nr:hypothetical protein DFS34DRAFT_588826 [Phlyctochytrium arcticum]